MHHRLLACQSSALYLIFAYTYCVDIEEGERQAEQEAQPPLLVTEEEVEALRRMMTPNDPQAHGKYYFYLLQILIKICMPSIASITYVYMCKHAEIARSLFDGPAVVDGAVERACDDYERDVASGVLDGKSFVIVMFYMQ